MEQIWRRKFTKEQCERLSIAQKGRKAWNKGISPSNEVKDKISKSLKGRSRPEGVKQKISKSHMGIRPTPETIEKLRKEAKEQWKIKKGIIRIPYLD
jgi:uncharacterized protein YdhG (YjbR/CyaY superfamily)